MIGRLDLLIFDCPDPAALAAFYSQMLGTEVYETGEDWAEISSGTGERPLIAFQRVDGYTPPKWPTQEVPQQVHLDIKVDEFDVAEPAVLALGATKAGSDSETCRVYLDPAGHPFCLIKPQD
jgi:hypothetical protein